jgi:hypothetical protein
MLAGAQHGAESAGGLRALEIDELVEQRLFQQQRQHQDAEAQRQAGREPVGDRYPGEDLIHVGQCTGSRTRGGPAVPDQ